MKDLAALLAGFQYTAVFDAIGEISRVVALSITPVLLLVSIHIRLMETQLDGLTRGSKWGDALRDILVFSFVLGVYFAIGDYIFGMLNSVYAWIDAVTSMEKITVMMSDLIDQHKPSGDSSEAGLWDNILKDTSILSVVYIAVSALCYYGTMLLLAFITAFLKFGHALIFGVAFIWGLIAIPVSVSQSLNILRGWGLLMGFALAWPIVQGLMLMLLQAVFFDAGSQLLEAEEFLNLTDIGNLYMLMALMHLMLCAVLIAAPIITNALVSNSPGGFAASMPFVAAAAASAKMSWSASKAGGGSAASRMLGKNKNSDTNNTEGGGSGMSAGDSTPKPKRTPVSAEAKSKQDRRGYFANKQKKQQQENGGDKGSDK